MREEAYASKDILLKAVSSMGTDFKKSRARSPTERNIWNRAKFEAETDPHLWPARSHFYRQITDYVETHGGIRSEVEEEILLHLKKQLESGHPVNRNIVNELIISHGLAIVNDPSLKDLIFFMGNILHIEQETLAKILRDFEMQNQLMKEMKERQMNLEKRTREQLEEMEEQEVSKVMEEMLRIDSRHSASSTPPRTVRVTTSLLHKGYQSFSASKAPSEPLSRNPSEAYLPYLMN